MYNDTVLFSGKTGVSWTIKACGSSGSVKPAMHLDWSNTSQRATKGSSMGMGSATTTVGSRAAYLPLISLLGLSGKIEKDAALWCYAKSKRHLPMTFLRNPRFLLRFWIICLWTCDRWGTVMQTVKCSDHHQNLRFDFGSFWFLLSHFWRRRGSPVTTLHPCSSACRRHQPGLRLFWVHLCQKTCAGEESLLHLFQ